MDEQSTQSAIGAQNEAVLELFESELAEVRFPGLDGEVLKQAADQVRQLAREVEKAEALLRSTRAAMEEAQEQLGLRCIRAVSYARVYAEERPELAERLEGLLPSRSRRGKPEPEQSDAEGKKPRRRAKVRVQETSLFEEGEPRAEPMMLQAVGA